MNSLIAIHHRTGSFSDRWIELCRERGIDYKIVDCLRNDCISQLEGCDMLLWHWAHHNTGDVIAAKAIIQSAEMRGLKVYPDMNTCWHFDEKISQKYLLESIGAQIAPTYVFYAEDDALLWLKKTSMPKVFKLSKGAASSNVMLVKTKKEARALIKKSFRRGIKHKSGYFYDAKKKVTRLKKRKDYFGALTRMPKAFFLASKQRSNFIREKNYAYFQDYIPGNTHDTRITIIGNRAFGFIRHVREGDFRASGSGLFEYTPELIDRECVSTAFRISRAIKCQSLAVDFVKGVDGQPLVLEISYGFCCYAIYGCPGYWDSEHVWHDGHFWPQDAILEDLLNSVTADDSEGHTRNKIIDCQVTVDLNEYNELRR